MLLNRIGMFTNGNDGFYFDEFSVGSLVCQNRWEVDERATVISNASSVYVEKYNLSYKLK